jgi:hypothetical protein
MINTLAYSSGLIRDAKKFYNTGVSLIDLAACMNNNVGCDNNNNNNNSYDKRERVHHFSHHRRFLDIGGKYHNN